MDSHFVGLLENKLEKTKLVRVDSDIIDNLIPKAEHKSVELSAVQRNIYTTLFRSQLPKDEKVNYMVSFEAISPESAPIVLTQNEYMRRMKDMAALQPGMSFYGEMPDSYSVIINISNPVVERVTKAADDALEPKIAPLVHRVEDDEKELSELRGKENENKEEEQKKIRELEDSTKSVRDEQEKMVSEYAASQPIVKQLIDLALLGNGMLKGEALNAFINRSLSML